MIGEENEKDLRFIKIIACFVIYSVIGIVAFFVFAISRVDAAPLFRVWDNTTWVADGNATDGIYRYPYSDNTFIYVNRVVYQTDTNVFTSGHKYNVQFQLKNEHRIFAVSAPINAQMYIRWQTSSNSLWDGTDITNKCNISSSQSSTYYASNPPLGETYQKNYRFTVTCNNITAPQNIQRMVFEYRESGSSAATMFFYSQVLKLVVEDTENMSEGEKAIIDNIGTAAADITNSIDNGTNNIINNNNNNTQSIINNNNNNTQQIIESGKVCTLNGEIPQSAYSQGYVGANGQIVLVSTNEENYTTKFIKVSPNTQYTYKIVESSWSGFNNNNWIGIGQYTQENYNSFISRTTMTTTTQNYVTFTTSPTTNYIIISARGLNNARTQFVLGGLSNATETCQNGNQAVSDGINDLNSSITDSSIDNPSGALNNMHNYFGDNGVISDLLLLPVRMFQSIVNTIDGTCSPFNLGTLFGHQLTMPCINLSSRLGSSLYGVIDILISGFFILTIRKKFVDIFEHFTSLKTGGNELE